MSIKPTASYTPISQPVFSMPDCDLFAEDTDKKIEIAPLSQSEESSHVGGAFKRSLPIPIPQPKNHSIIFTIDTEILNKAMEKSMGSLGLSRKFPVTRRTSADESINEEKSRLIRTHSNPNLIQKDSFETNIDKIKPNAKPFLCDTTVNLHFTKRKGVYAYFDLKQELRSSLDAIDKQVDTYERGFPPIDASGAEFIRRNGDVLKRELLRLNNELGPLYSTFVELVRFHQYVQENQGVAWAARAKELQFNEKLESIIQSLEQHLKIVQDCKYEFRHLGSICVEIKKQIDQKNIGGFSFPDLDGSVRFHTLPNMELECRMVRVFYSLYCDEFLEAHEVYFSQFLTTALQLRLAVNTT